MLSSYTYIIGNKENCFNDNLNDIILFSFSSNIVSYKNYRMPRIYIRIHVSTRANKFAAEILTSPRRQYPINRNMRQNN